MKKLICLLAVAGTVSPAFSQDFSGYRSGNFTGVTGVLFNPANIADNRYKFDVNLFSTNIMAGNNKAGIRLKDVVKNTFEFDGDSLLNKVISPDAGATSLMANVQVLGPSFMYSIGKKSAFALTTRARAIVNMRDVDGKFVDKLISDFEEDVTLPYTLRSQEDMQVSVNGFAELGLSYARVLMNKEEHFLKGGITAKYLVGVSNMYLNIGNFNATIEEDQLAGDVYLRNTTGRLALGVGGVNIDDFGMDEILKMNNTGLGADIGFVYEFRPDHAKFHFGKENKERRDLNKYKLKFGMALLDIGSIRYHRDSSMSGDYTMHIDDPERLYLDDVSETEAEDLKQFFRKRPQFFTPGGAATTGSYTVSLPTTLQLDVDYHIYKGFYVQGNAQISLAGTDKKPFTPSYYSGFSITPRFEGRMFGAYLPVQYNQLTNLNAGIAFRTGPLFFGSGSIVSGWFGESKQADVFLGIRISALYKNGLKAERKNQ